MNTTLDYLPSPLERPSTKGFDRQGGIFEVSSDPMGKFLAQVFKVTHNPHHGRLVHFSAFRGVLNAKNQPVVSVTREEKERPTKRLQVLADDCREVDNISIGDIFAMVRDLSQ